MLHRAAVLVERERPGATQVSYKDYAQKTLAPLAALARKGARPLCSALGTQFTFYRNKGVGPGKFTAYQNPVVHASRKKKGAFQYPLYRRPPGALTPKIKVFQRFLPALLVSHVQFPSSKGDRRTGVLTLTILNCLL